MLDQDNQFIQIADTLTFITDDEKDADLDEKERLVNFHKHPLKIVNVHFQSLIYMLIATIQAFQKM